MENYIILIICFIILIAYIFDITGKYTRIPSVILLILLGILLQIIADVANINIPDLKPYLPVVGTVGLILIVLEASLDLKLEKRKINLIYKSVLSAIILLIFFVTGMAFFIAEFMHYDFRTSLLNTIPFGVISSAVAISSSVNLCREEREFVVYESSVSDITGILAFDFILLNYDSLIKGFIANFILGGTLTIIIAVIVTTAMALLLHKSKYHVNYIIIITTMICVYVLAKLVHLPSLLLILIFGLFLSNSRLVENTALNKYVNFQKFRDDVESFRRITGELTFIVRSFFFIIFGFYIKIEGLFEFRNLIAGVVIILFIFLIRFAILKMILRTSAIPLLYFAPRGLITILLFISIPEISRITFLNEEVVTLVILISMVFLVIGNIKYGRREMPEPAVKGKSIISDQ